MGPGGGTVSKKKTSNNDENFSFRWGIEIFDNSHTSIPNWVLAYYHKVPWATSEGELKIGISNTEMMLIIHLASFRWETENGEASPSLTVTLKERMNYTSNQGIINIIQSLEEKNLLIVRRSIGKRSVYDFTPFSRAIERIAMEELVNRNQSTKVDRSRKVDPSTKVDGNQSTFVDGNQSTKVDSINKTDQRKEKKEKGSPSAEEISSLSQPEQPSTLKEENPQLKDSPAAGPDYLAHIVQGKAAGVAPVEPAYDVVFGYRDEFLKIYNDKTGQYLADPDLKAEVADLGTEAGANPAIWEKAIVETKRNWSGKHNPPFSRYVEVYRAGGSYEAWKRQAFPEDQPSAAAGKPSARPNLTEEQIANYHAIMNGQETGTVKLDIDPEAVRQKYERRRQVNNQSSFL